MKPAWRQAKSAEDYVDRRLVNANSGLAAQLEIFVGLSVPDADDRRRDEQRRVLAFRVLVRAVELARRVHPQIKYEEAQLKEAKKFLGRIEKFEKWVLEAFNNPKYTMRYVEPRDGEGERIPQDILDMVSALTESGQTFGFDLEKYRRYPNIIDPEAIRTIKDRLRYRIKVAENRWYLAGVTREVKKAAPEHERDMAAVRFGAGELALWMMYFVPGWNPKQPTSFQLDSLAELAEELFGVPGEIGSKQVRHALATTVRIARDRGEGEEWFG
jgi:hypothetical protein